MSADISRQSGRLTWYVRHYAWLVIACVLALAAAPLLLAGSQEPRYEAETLVVAQQLTANQEVLPKLAQSVFAGGAVESAVAEDPAVAGENLIPERLSVVTAEDSIAIVVQARDEDPTVAARLANLAAEAYVVELNRGGAGVGTFAVQAPAIVPSGPMSTAPPLVRAAAGALGGLVLGIGLVALVRTIRRPVLDLQDVEEAAGAPLLGIVELPRVRDSFPGPRGVRGVAAVSRWLAGVPGGRLLVVSTAADAGPRQRLFVMVAAALRSVRGVTIEAPPEVARAVERHALDDVTLSNAAPDLLLIDGGSPVDLFSPGMVNVSVVAVAPRGVPRRTLRRLVSEYVGNGLVGVILLDEQIGVGRAAGPVRAQGSVWSRLRTQKADYVQEPGRA